MNNLEKTALKDIWPQILDHVEDCQVATVCTFFKDFFYNQAKTEAWVSNKLREKQLNHLLKENLRDTVIQIKLQNIDKRPLKTIKENNIERNRFGIIKLFREDVDIAECQRFDELGIKNNPNFSRLKLHAKAEAIRMFLLNRNVLSLSMRKGN